jgi:hypothetical protein
MIKTYLQRYRFMFFLPYQANAFGDVATTSDGIKERLLDIP